MIWHLTYQINKDLHKTKFWDEYYRAKFHPNVPHWERVFNIDCSEEIKDLNLEGLNVSPRYSYQWANTQLPEHVDEDEIIGININLMDHPVDIHLRGEKHSYECAVIDVGHVPHSVEPVDYDRLILKFAIREPLDVVLERTKCLRVNTTS